MDCRLAKDCIVRLALRFPSLRPIKPAMDVIRPPGFHFHSHMSIRCSEPYGPTPALGRTWKTGRPLRLLTSCCRKELAQQTTHLQNPDIMVTIRLSRAGSDVALICLEATFTTPRSVYTISSNGPMMDLATPLAGGVFGAISWPRSRFRLAIGVVLEQQMFLPLRPSQETLRPKIVSKLPRNGCAVKKLGAEPTGLEPATSAVTGRRSNQLS